MKTTKSNNYQKQMEKFEITVNESSFILPIRKNGQDLELHFFEINHLELKKYQAPLLKKVIFWVVRFLTFNRETGNSLYQDKLGYKWKYVLNFNTKSGKIYKVIISDFDLFQVSSMVENMNKNWFK